MSFSASVGWNQQVGELSTILVEDPCAAPAGHPKYFWDSTLTKQSTLGADPGFVGLTQDIIGMPAFFRVEDFEFSGIVQSWEELKSESGNPTYSVKLMDPREILSGVELITGNYSCDRDWETRNLLL